MLTAKEHWTIARLAYWYLDRGRAKEAEKLARGLLAMNQHDGEAWMYYGEARRQQGDEGEAARGFEQAARLLSDRADIWMRYGETLLRMGRYDEARRALETAGERAESGDPIGRRIQALTRRCTP